MRAELHKQALNDLDIGAKATWSSHHNENTKLKRLPDRKRVAEKIQESIRADLKKIEGGAPEAHKVAARSLRDTIKHDGYSSWYEKDQCSVTCSVIPGSGETTDAEPESAAGARTDVSPGADDARDGP